MKKIEAITLIRRLKHWHFKSVFRSQYTVFFYFFLFQHIILIHLPIKFVTKAGPFTQNRISIFLNSWFISTLCPSAGYLWPLDVLLVSISAASSRHCVDQPWGKNTSEKPIFSCAQSSFLWPQECVLCNWLITHSVLSALGKCGLAKRVSWSSWVVQNQQKPWIPQMEGTNP